MTPKELYAQGDILLERVEDADPLLGQAVVADSDGAVVLARGEVTGHRHRIAGDSGVALFRDDGLARGVPDNLYIGHIAVGPDGADLVHEEHATIRLPAGTYRVRRQREFETGMSPRVVED